MLDLACQLQMQCSSTTMNCHIALRYVTSHIFFLKILVALLSGMWLVQSRIMNWLYQSHVHLPTLKVHEQLMDVRPGRGSDLPRRRARGGTRGRRQQAICGLMHQSVVPPTVLDGRVPQDLLSSEDVVFDDMNSVSWYSQHCSIPLVHNNLGLRWSSCSLLPCST